MQGKARQNRQRGTPGKKARQNRQKAGHGNAGQGTSEQDDESLQSPHTEHACTVSPSLLPCLLLLREGNAFSQ
jgi:hypothetical protein